MEWWEAVPGRVVDGAVSGAAVGDVEGFFVRGEGDAVGLHQAGVDDLHGARRRAKTVHGRLEGGGPVGDVLLVSVQAVGEEDVAAAGVDQIVGRVERRAKIIIQKGGDLVGGGVESHNAGPLNGEVGPLFQPAHGPVHPALVILASVDAIHWRIGGEVG